MGKSTDNCRQIAVRARRQVEERRPRFEVSPRKRHEVAARFFDAVSDGDVDGLIAMLATDAVAYTDGGGKARAVLGPVRGPEAIADLFLPARALQSRLVDVNGQPGAVLVDRTGEPASSWRGCRGRPGQHDPRREQPGEADASGWRLHGRSRVSVGGWMTRLTIVGATGGIGGHLVQQALSAGHDVVAAVRSPEIGRPRACRPGGPGRPRPGTPGSLHRRLRRGPVCSRAAGEGGVGDPRSRYSGDRGGDDLDGPSFARGQRRWGLGRPHPEPSRPAPDANSGAGFANRYINTLWRGRLLGEHSSTWR